MTSGRLNLLDVECWVLCWYAENLNLRKDLLSVLLQSPLERSSKWDVEGVKSYAWVGTTHPRGSPPLPPRFRLDSYHKGSAGVDAYAFARTGRGDTVTELLVLYREDVVPYAASEVAVFDKRYLQARAIAQAARRRVSPGASVILSGWRVGRIAAQVGIAYNHQQLT
jgi:hypothetical protein